MELKIEKYCDSCPMIDPVANVHQEAIHAEHPIYGDQLIANTRVTITCRNAERCRNMFNYIHSVPSEDKPDAKPDKQYSDAFCTRCWYNAWNRHCLPCKECELGSNFKPKPRVFD